MKKRHDIRADILAGGSGTRFWPLSRKKMPKQFLPIVSSKTMLEETARRILPLIPRRKICAIANAEQTRVVGRLLPDIPRENFLVEPDGKNTAPSLILATAWIYLKNPEAVIVVLPSDHLIADRATFLRKLEAAAEAAANEEVLITFGIPPAFPSTGYGYIHYQKEKAKRYSEDSFYEVKAFKEKPSYETAVEFLRSGEYYWNSGMFLWRADVFARKMEEFAPDYYSYWEPLLDALKAGSKTRIRAIFKTLPAISIDYALMEKAQGVLVCEGNFGWSDVGAWSSLADIWEKDDAGNVVKGESVIMDSQNAICYNPEKLTALIGVKDLIVVNTKDALLLCRKDLDQKVKEVLEALKKKGKARYL